MSKCTNPDCNENKEEQMAYCWDCHYKNPPIREDKPETHIALMASKITSESKANINRVDVIQEELKVIMAESMNLTKGYLEELAKRKARDETITHLTTENAKLTEALDEVLKHLEDGNDPHGDVKALSTIRKAKEQK